MSIIKVVCEGQTEQAFVNRVLKPALEAQSIFVKASCVGGGLSYKPYRKDIENSLREKPAYDVVTSMIDYYRLPSNFPGWTLPTRAKGDPYARVRKLEEAFAENIADERFLPGIVLHEYEGLLFTSPEAIADVVAEGRLLPRIERILKEFHGNPEAINERPEKSPALRLKKLYPAYDKRDHGPRIAERIGLSTLRAKCQHFNAWLTEIERRCASVTT
ncbi:DUF4276 family protein [Chondromyces apiculatus]|uniref:DUF4276 family protein n=1 Tax=Chondromyces apiculatus DSM 436 TaxID=1192034 RepID=A0A017T7M0_9BACT|nr:DUF4276 family protein [Chondromyces apiculatus]EYF05239.1 Hypothetical protein CAP_3379 [Chondromyces apiculatus DSM 436]